MSWHWESYVHKNNLWYHFRRFNEAIKGIDPVSESFTPFYTETDQLRIYILKGKRTTLLWIRDKMNNWESELAKNVPPALIENAILNLPGSGSGQAIDVYDPWTNEWKTVKSKDDSITLPDFKRSVIIRLRQ